MQLFSVIFFYVTLTHVWCTSPFKKNFFGSNSNVASGFASTWGQFNSPGINQVLNGGNRSISGGLGTNIFETMFQWNIMEFAYPTERLRSQALSSRQYIPRNIAPLGIAATHNRVFISTPRWNNGIPASLSKIDLPAYSQSPALQPYPSWNHHSPTTNPDCSKLLSVYRLTIDECGRLFVIDSGIVNALTNLQQLCPPKIVAFDLATDQQVLLYEFPPDQVLQGSLHTNIVVDVRNGQCNRGFVYVMDVWRNGIVVYDIQQGTSWRTMHHFYNSDPFSSDYNYKGINFQWTDGVFGASLSPLNKPDEDRILYFHPMSSNYEFAVRTSVLQNQTAWTTRTAPSQAFIPLGMRGQNGQSSTTAMAPTGVLFAAQIQLEGVSCWDTRKPYNLNNIQMIQRDSDLLGFVNDLKLDTDRESIWAVSNNLPTFIYGNLDYSQINFRLLRANVLQAITNTICDPQVNANLAPVI